MEHYFSEKPVINSNEKEIQYEINDKKFKFITDNGVFSKAKVDFGTDVMLKEILKQNKYKMKKYNLLDIGCGYGVVSIVLKSFFPNLEIMLTDVNERALELSSKNLENAGIQGYTIKKSFSFDNIDNIFDVIVSNPPIRAGKSVIFDIYEKSFLHLAKFGEFYCVIQTKHGAKSTEKHLREIFGNVETLNIDNGYRIYRSIKNN